MPYLQFKGKVAVENYHHTVPHHSLEFDTGLSVFREGAKPSLDDNLIIEGDNLLALKALLPTHAGRIKCIYIDPPYNTGNEKWVYNDNLTQPQFKEWIGQVVGKEGEDFLRHDKWCCMMYQRLCLLKELLRDDGVIFVSIDDNEVANLRLLMDEIFGGENLIANLTVVTNLKGNNSEYGFAGTHEYALVYAKNRKIKQAIGEFSLSEDELENYDLEDENGPYKQGATLMRTGEAGGRDKRPRGFYPIYVSLDLREIRTRRIMPTDIEIFPRQLDGTDMSWRWEPRTVARDSIDIIAKRTSFGISLYKKQRPNIGDVARGKKPKTIFYKSSYSSGNGTAQVQGLFGSKVFANPKAVSLILDFVTLGAGGNGIVLDSFAGSATTAQAVLELNEIGGDRKFVLVQQPYDTKEDEENRKNICATVTAERVRRVIVGTPKYPPVRGSFTYARLSAEPLFGEYRDLGERLPAYDEIAKYVFYTETSREWQPNVLNHDSGYIGQVNGTSYYLLYLPNRQEDWSLDSGFLNTVAANDPNKHLVIYCEKVWVHKDDLRRWQKDNSKSVRQMIVPFNLR